MRKPAVISNGVWVVEVEVDTSYGVRDASRILRCSTSYVRHLVKEGQVEGPASTAKKPVDHSRLVEFLQRRWFKWKRDVMRAELREQMAGVLGRAADESPTVDDRPRRKVWLYSTSRYQRGPDPG